MAIKQVQAVACTYWTTGVHESIQISTKALKGYLDLCNLQISKIVDLVRGPLKLQNRITLGIY